MGPAAAPDGAGGGVAFALAIWSASHVSKSAFAIAWTSNSIDPWKAPHSSAHWPR